MARRIEVICPNCGKGPVIRRERVKGLQKKAYRSIIERCQTCNFYLKRDPVKSRRASK
jgi:uncharacterized Zn finger protein